MRNLIGASLGVLMLSAAPAFAACVDDIAEAEATLQNATLNETDRQTAQALIEQAKGQANVGNEASCEATIAQVNTILGVQ